MKSSNYYCELLIIGGGAAGAFAGIKAGEEGTLDTIVVDKGHIKRSGCLASGINAINAYLDEDEDINNYIQYVKNEFEEIVREDLLYTIGKKLNSVTKDIESYGLTILKDGNGNYVKRGKRSIKINGENIKVILEKKLKSFKNIRILNFINIIQYIKIDDRIVGAIGIDLKNEEIVMIHSKVTIVATGGAAGIYNSDNKGIKKHRMWYSPFNVGAGYAMGILAGAEMTSFEMRFIALRVRETIAPTGTVAQGIKAVQINSKAEEYMKKYNLKTTAMRLYGTVIEEKEGRGPCYLKTIGITENTKDDLKKAYLNMSPAEVLRWFDKDLNLENDNLEITGTEPYIVGGHSSSGYWVDINRRTTIKALYAIGDVAGGSPKKYVTGAFAEGEIAILDILKNKNEYLNFQSNYNDEKLIDAILNPLFLVNRCDINSINLRKKLGNENFNLNNIEEDLKETMDNYAGGKATFYQYNEKNLTIAKKKINELLEKIFRLEVKSLLELSAYYDLKAKIYVALVLIEHLLARKEKRIRIYQENEDYSFKDDNYKIFINSVFKNGEIKILKRNLK